MMTATPASASKTEASFHKLIEGVAQFQTSVFPRLQDAMERTLVHGQSPHALFITCADSRVDPEALTQSTPGEIFVLRNIGNMVPPYGEMLGGVSAVVEYAVAGLGVDQVVICGHTDCGAMKGLLDKGSLTHLPTVGSWLKNGEAALRIAAVKESAGAKGPTLASVIEENVLLQLKHLATHPSVAERLAAKSLLVTGWIYDLAHGAVRVYADDQEKFVSYREFL